MPPAPAAMRLALAAVLLLALASCDTGAFTRVGDADVTIRGEVAETAQWGARFGDGALLSISTQTPSLRVVAVDVDVTRLVPGRYVIGVRRSLEDPDLATADPFGAGLTIYGRGLPAQEYVAGDGVLTLDAVTAREVRGSLAFTAFRRLGLGTDSTRSVDIEARFRAEYVPFCC